MRVKPAPGLTVRDPHSKAALPPEGRDVPDYDVFWLRRLRDGDVILDQPAPAPDMHARHAARKET